MSSLIQGLAAGVGFASESIHYHKEQRRQKKREAEALEQDQTSPRDATREIAEVEGSQSPQNEDEAAWQLDDMQAELASEAPPSYAELDGTDGRAFDESTAESAVDVPRLSADFISQHPLSTQLNTPMVRRLELPVVLTQRRPKARTRGFIRAYAPILEEAGIDQPTFLDFVDKLNKAVEPSPWIQAINLASFAAQHVPEPVTIAVSIACKVVADAAAEAHSRAKTNAFLDKVNDEFFKPRGLVAIVMTWKPSDPRMITDVDFNLGSKIRAASGPSSSSPTASQSTFSKLKHRMQSSSGSTDFEFPETAPLIFPALDAAASTLADNPEAEAKKQNALQRGGTFINDYLDRRAVAKWSDAHPDSKMANQQPRPEFHSRYADPTHPASSGDLVAFVTGGKLSASPQLRERGALPIGPAALLQTFMPDGRGRIGGMQDRLAALQQRRKGARDSPIERGIDSVKSWGADRKSVLGARMAALQAQGLGGGRGAMQMRVREVSAPNDGDGGQLNRYGEDDERYARRQVVLQQRPVARLGGGGLGGGGLVGGVKKLLQHDVLYLLIVNRPTDEQIAEAAEEYQYV